MTVPTDKELDEIVLRLTEFAADLDAPELGTTETTEIVNAFVALRAERNEWKCEALVRRDTVVDLRAEVAALKEEREDWARRFMLDGRTPWEWENLCKRAEAEVAEYANGYPGSAYRELKDRSDKAEAEVERLRDLLRRAHATMADIPSPPYPWDEIDAALKD
jgi:hypothetical protein